jgi:hypothetical protein
MDRGLFLWSFAKFLQDAEELPNIQPRGPCLPISGPFGHTTCFWAGCLLVLQELGSKMKERFEDIEGEVLK